MALESKGMYISANRTKGVSIYVTNADGVAKDFDEKISTINLINAFLMKTSQDWQGRAKAAQLLANRREVVTPPALLNCMGTDPNLSVRRAALLSFEQLTGFQEADVFAFKDASESWPKNRDAYLKSLPK
jgi:hypothetical protein